MTTSFQTYNVASWCRHHTIITQVLLQTFFYALDSREQDELWSYGIAYLRVLKISQNKALKRKYMTAYLKSFHKHATWGLDLCMLSCHATYSKSSVIHPLVIFAIILIVYL